MANFLPALILLGSLLPTLVQCQAKPARKPGTKPGVQFEVKRKPNIVLLMADELGYFELSCMGHPHIQTPRIDALAAGGMRFTQCLAGAPVCAPTRCTLLTGKHTGHASVRSNGGGTPLRAGEPTLGSVLKAAGYATGGFGKWGCGGRGSTGVPEKHGFDTFVGYYDQVHAHTYYPPYILRNSEELPLANNRGMSDGETYSHYRIFDEAKKFIRANKDRPFLCYLPVTPPHGLFDIPDDDPAWQLYKDRTWPEPARRYAAMITMLDRQLGELQGLLKELQLTDDTIVIFCGDNGGNDYFRTPERPRGFHQPNVDPKTGVAFRGTKGSLYEGGLRIPMIVSWPGKIRPGSVSDHLSYFPDLLPTLAECAQATAPDDVDGISMVPEWLGEAAGRPQEQHPYLYWEHGRQVAVRAGSYKAYRGNPRKDWELYDLEADPSETKNLAAAKPEVLARLQAFATAAHTPVESGTFADRTLHEKDRRAKGAPMRRGRGGRRRPAVVPFPTEGVLSRAGWSVLRASSAAQAANRQASMVLDGDPRTHWHSAFRPQPLPHPHTLVIDMGKPRTLAGFIYQARQDSGWNGTFETVDFYVGDDPKTLGTGKPYLTHRFAKSRKPQKAPAPPTTARYFMVRTRSAQQGGVWGSAAEIGALKD